MKIPAGPWLPDRPPLANPGLVSVRNAIPDAGFYRPLRGLTNIRTAAVPTTPRGLFTFRRGAVDWTMIYAAGARLYLINDAGGALVDLSRGGADYIVAANERWRGIQTGDAALLTNYREPIQYINASNPVAFADLGGSPPKARYIAQVRDRVVLAYINDTIDGEQYDRIQWNGLVNGLPDLESWAPSLETGADFQPVPDIGIIKGLTGGQFGTVLGETGIARLSPGGPAVFQVDNVSQEIGCKLSESVIRYGPTTFWYSDEGWMRFSGQGIEPIANAKVDRWFRNDMDFDEADRMWAAPGPEPGVLCWAYCGAGHLNRPNRLLLYNIFVNEWSVADIVTDLVALVVTFGGDLDDVTDDRWDDLDAWDGDLDDASLWSRAVRTGGIVGDQLQAFTGEILPATFETTEFEMQPGRRTVAKLVTALRSQGTATLTVGVREKAGQAREWIGPMNEQADGFFRMREEGRFHTLRTTLADWRDFQGLEVEGAVRGRR